MDQKYLTEMMQFDQYFYNRESYIRQWYQCIYQSQLLLAQRKQKRKAETHKTVPCQAWKDTGRCNYGKRCKFAHGPKELRPIPKTTVKVFNNPRYRTALCIKYTTFGFCPYGDQCHFIHNPEPVDLEKCLEQLTTSPLPQIDDCSDNASLSGAASECTNLAEWREKNQLQLISESQAANLAEWREKNQLKLISESESELEPESEAESIYTVESEPETDSEEAARIYDPFKTKNVNKAEIEFKSLQFNVTDDFLNVINSQRVLPQKQ